jgi:tetratricopeptide (TPR) repeat protein
LFVGWFWFIGMLVPVIGVVQAGNQALADRYTYLPAIGLTILLVWGTKECAMRLALPRLVRNLAAGCFLAGGVIQTRAYLPKWQDTITLFKHAITVTGPHAVALKNMGLAYKRNGQLAEARQCYEQTLELEPNDPITLFNLGGLLLLQGAPDEALIPLRRAVDRAIRPDEATAFANMGLMLAESRQPADAMHFYRKALEGNPDSIDALNNLAWLLATTPEDSLRNGPEAVRWAERAAALTGERVPVVLGTLAAAYAEAGQFDIALRTAQKAHDLAREAKQDDLAKRNAELLELYRSGKPFREN